MSSKCPKMQDTELIVILEPSGWSILCTKHDPCAAMLSLAAMQIIWNPNPCHSLERLESVTRGRFPSDDNPDSH